MTEKQLNRLREEQREFSNDPSYVQQEFENEYSQNEVPIPFAGKLLMWFIALGMLACIGAQVAQKLYLHFHK